MKRIVFSEKKCTACGACAVACMDENDIDTAAGQRPFRSVARTEKEGRSIYISSACRHCANPACAAACPTGAVYRDGETGLVLTDTERCSGCGACEAACPFGAVSLWEGKISKCGGCYERVAAGLLPACVRACPTGALTYAGS